MCYISCTYTVHVRLCPVVLHGLVFEVPVFQVPKIWVHLYSRCSPSCLLLKCVFLPFAFHSKVSLLQDLQVPWYSLIHPDTAELSWEPLVSSSCTETVRTGKVGAFWGSSRVAFARFSFCVIYWWHCSKKSTKQMADFGYIWLFISVSRDWPFVVCWCLVLMFPFLVRWENILSGSHALHRFIR